MTEKSDYISQPEYDYIADTIEPEITLEQMPFAYTLKAMTTSSIMLHSSYKLLRHEQFMQPDATREQLSGFKNDIHTAITELGDSYQYLVEALSEEVRYDITPLNEAAAVLRALYSEFEIDNAMFMQKEMQEPYAPAPTAEELQERFERQLSELVYTKDPHAVDEVGRSYREHLAESFSTYTRH